MNDLERATALARDLWTLLAKADEMMSELMDALERVGDAPDTGDILASVRHEASEVRQ